MLSFTTSLSAHPLSIPNSLRTHNHQSTLKKLTTNTSRVCTVIKCSNSARKEKEADSKDYYQLLGVAVDSTSKEIKEAYRRLQKKHHPDIAGNKGHEYTLMLNEAYRALIREDLRRRYDVSSGRKSEGFESHFSGLGYSSWNGPTRPQALFVDENKCIGCRECVHNANNTFAMDEALGCARVKVQFGDDERKIQVSVESCPVNCIHWVESEELPLLEFLIRPQHKEAHGVFGGGWERPPDVFAAAKSFEKKLKRQQEQNHPSNGAGAMEDETPAQAQARYEASMKLRLERFMGMWGWWRQLFASQSKGSSKESFKRGFEDTVT